MNQVYTGYLYTRWLKNNLRSQCTTLYTPQTEEHNIIHDFPLKLLLKHKYGAQLMCKYVLRKHI